MGILHCTRHEINQTMSFKNMSIFLMINLREKFVFCSYEFFRVKDGEVALENLRMIPFHQF